MADLAQYMGGGSGFVVEDADKTSIYINANEAHDNAVLYEIIPADNKQVIKLTQLATGGSSGNADGIIVKFGNRIVAENVRPGSWASTSVPGFAVGGGISGTFREFEGAPGEKLTILRNAPGNSKAYRVEVASMAGRY